MEPCVSGRVASQEASQSSGVTSELEEGSWRGLGKEKLQKPGPSLLGPPVEGLEHCWVGCSPSPRAK